MRIVGGALRGRAIAAPKGDLVRPTGDRTREALFNILAHADFDGFTLEAARVLDLFAYPVLWGSRRFRAVLPLPSSWRNTPKAGPVSVKTWNHSASMETQKSTSAMRRGLGPGPEASAPPSTCFCRPALWQGPRRRGAAFRPRGRLAHRGCALRRRGERARRFRGARGFRGGRPAAVSRH